MINLNIIIRAVLVLVLHELILVTGQCPPPIPNCNFPTVNRFRTIDGTCNNLNNPLWGAGNISFVRWLQRVPSGHDFRCPNCVRPRDVSFELQNLLPEGQNDGITLSVMQWGQFIDHDLVFTPEVTDESCCSDFSTPTGSTSDCFPIDVTGDPIFSNCSTPRTCLPFVRSRNCPGLPNRENINELTAYLDGSMVYGSSIEVSDSLRSFSGGKLKVGSGSETLSCSGEADICPWSFLPTFNNNGEENCFAGDVRVSEQPALASLHTVFLRLHNDLATVINCGNDELTFHVTRKIVGAIVQQITYNEFLPIVLGPNFMNSHGLTLGSFSGYQPNIRASAPNVFATAAFRFGHSLIPDVFTLSSGTTVKLAESFNNCEIPLNPNSFPSHFMGSIITNDARPMDHILVDAVSNKLFATSPFECGSDLFSRNIQRGRDHGIPGYIFWLFECTGIQITSFSDLRASGLMPTNVVDKFQVLYNTVDEIDLFPAGIAEFEVAGGLVGPTFACIIAGHFANIKYGDRFWFERTLFFTSSQIQSIYDTTLASIICPYTNVNDSQLEVMRVVSPGNPLLSCANILVNGVLNDISTNIWSGICNQ